MVTAEEIIKAVNASLGYYPWSGECIGVHKNEWGEWIADCHIWGPRGYSPDDPTWHWYHEGDEDCPIDQKMIEVHKDPYRWGLGYPWIRMWDAKNDKRLPSFIEEGGIMLDPDAPPSPYIVEPIKAYIEAHKNDPNPF